MDHQNSSRGKSDHWDLLASTLGAVPPPESAERPAEAEPSPQAQPAEEPEAGLAPSAALTEPPSFDQADLLVLPEPAETPPGEPLSGVSEEIVSESRRAGASVAQEQEDLFASLPQSTFVPPRPERRKTPQDWARLASQLGVELPPEAFEPIQTTAETTLEPAPRPSIVVTTLETEPLPSAGKPGTKPREEEAAFSRRRKPTARTSSSFGKSLEQADTVSTTTSAGTQAKGDDVDDLLLLPEEAEETPGQAEASHAAQSSTGAAPADLQPAGTRAKRRRRRKKKSSAAAVETAEAALAQARERVESIEDRAFDADAHLAESAEPDLSDQNESDQNDDSESEERDEDKSGIHRSIPTWEEAVGIIIAANMEARAKNPERRSAYSPRNRNR